MKNDHSDDRSRMSMPGSVALGSTGAHGRDLPLVVQAGSNQMSGAQALASFWDENAEWLRSQLYQHGAILFRGFDISEQMFSHVSRHFGSEFLSYAGGNSPRTRLAAGIYTSTEYPADYFIPLHNELSYTPSWPSRIFFCCILEPKDGGQTPLLDSRVLLRNLPQDLMDEFKHRKIKYVRNLHGGIGFGRSWQQTFESTDRSVVEQHAALCDTEVRWNSDGSVSLSNVRPATVIHSVTGEEVWFNQADQFHPSTIKVQTAKGAELYTSLMAAYARREDRLPQNVFFGDGQAIPLDYFEIIRRISQDCMVTFKWKKGDLLMVDNVLTAHGRMPFTGQRRILVSMTAD